MVHTVTAKIYDYRSEGHEQQDCSIEPSHTLYCNKAVILRFQLCNTASIQDVSARLPALSQMTHNAPKKGRFNYPHYGAAAAPRLAISSAPRNIVSRTINPPVCHLRYADTRLHHNGSLCMRSLVSMTPFFREVTPCD